MKFARMSFCKLSKDSLCLNPSLQLSCKLKRFVRRPKKRPYSRNDGRRCVAAGRRLRFRRPGYLVLPTTEVSALKVARLGPLC
jgi:hypothetical protein